MSNLSGKSISSDILLKSQYSILFNLISSFNCNQSTGHYPTEGLPIFDECNNNKHQIRSLPTKSQLVISFALK